MTRHDMARISFEMTQSQVRRLLPQLNTVSRQMPNRDSGRFGRLFRLQLQVSRGHLAMQAAEITAQCYRHKIV